ncbi:MAG: response regulator [Burkholderiales bacterium]
MGEERTLRIVMAEDSAAVADLARYALKRARIAAHVVLATTVEDFRAALLSVRPHVIISDNSMPQFSGKEALRLARALAPDTPFIFLSGTLTPGYGSDEALAQANACLDKSDLDRLGALVKSLLQPGAGSQS